MDSYLHQNFSRQYVNEVGVPVFSIDYRLAPKFPYPDPVNDCFQAYYWIVTEGLRQLGINPQNILLVGDSAGGHLVTAVTIMSILRGVKKPSALCLNYPALCVDLNKFLPSTVFALDDPILNQSFLKYCLHSFTKNGGNPARNPLLSPIVASDEILSAFPPTRIMVCEVDPLRDGSYLFALRLKKLGIDVQLHLLKEQPHGFCSFDIKNFGIEECHLSVLKNIEMMKELLHIT